jgi:hypothetical protein
VTGWFCYEGVYQICTRKMHRLGPEAHAKIDQTYFLLKQSVDHSTEERGRKRDERDGGVA